jgi:hypothetical protein
MRDALVITCERSGTHLMIDTLRDSFGMAYKSASSDIDYKKINLAIPENMKKAIEEALACGHGNQVLKSHHPFCFFEPIWDWLKERLDVYYVVRDGRAVMASQWNHYRLFDVDDLGPVTFNVGDFMRADPAGTPMTRYHGSPPPANMVQRWADHILSWDMWVRPYVTYLRYEDDHRFTLESMAETTDIKPRTDKKPLVGGVTPWRGKTDTWKEFFTPEDEDYFWEYGRLAMKALGIERETAT